MKLIFAIILSVHGLIHLYGFVNEWFLTDMTGMRWKKIIHLSDRASKTVGIVWLATCIVFLTSALGLALEATWWRTTSIIGIIISQLLIILYIQYAWTGTMINILIALAMIWLLLPPLHN